MPLVYDVEHTGADCPEPPLLSFNQLSDINALPNPFEWSDGRSEISYFSDWRCRRAEIAKEIQHYEIGEKPARPDTIEASFEDGMLTVDVTVKGKTLTLTSNINLPEGEGPHPVVIGMGGTSLPGDIFTSRNIAQMNFNFGQVTAHTQTRGNEPINEIYPELEYIGSYSAWPWGVSRLIDGLELVKDEANIDLEHIAVSGCSFAGKMAIFAGAFDERIALTFGIESGGGGYTTWRYSEVLDRIESVETLARTNYSWFIQDMRQFSGEVQKLPMDHHELMAMVAPRALFVTGNPGFVWLADESGYVGSKATEKVYDALGISDRFTYSQVGGHNHCAIPASQRPDIEAYVDKFLLGIETETNLSTSPYTTPLGPWIPWETPELTVGESLFETTSLVLPENQSAGIDTFATFSWNEFADSEKYYFQLSTDATFKTLDVEDSSATNEIFIDNLEKGKRYYWRVQIKANSGSLSPWSAPFNFITSIQLPDVPELNPATIFRASRPNFYVYSWNETANADRYRVEISESPSFTSLVGSANTSNTSATIVGTEEGNRYYWRVNAENIAGSSPWSETLSFFVLAPPDDILIEDAGASGIRIKWDDNSDVEDGYIIERKTGVEGTYAVVDSLDADIEEWTDATGQNDHFYRVKAYYAEEGSDYSDEVSLTPVYTEDETDTPGNYSLKQNYPNPFNPVTTISFELEQPGLTKLTVYDLLGREMKTLVNEVRSAGNHQIQFDASNFASGIYIYMLESGDFSQTRKMVLMK